MSEFLTLPNYRQTLMDKANTSSPWYKFFSGLFTGKPPSAESTVTATTSPMTYTATQRGFMIVQGGTVSLVQWNRGGVTNHATGQTQGCFPVSQGDSLIITYSVAPTLTFVPQ